jgi:glycosyltransferase involved in cell wall biosynthesis
MKVSIIIPVYNSQDTLDLCLSAIYKSEVNDFEVLVVDDASTDSSIEIAKRYPCRLIELEENNGAAVARNKGVKNSLGAVVVFIDSDIVVYPKAIGSLIRDLESPHISGAVGLYSLENRYKNFLSQYKHMAVCFRDIMTDDVNQDSFKAAFVALKKEVFKDIFFDENFKRASIEDIEFGRALIAKGFRFVLDKDIQVEHVKRFSLKTYFKSQYRRAYDIGARYLTKEYRKFYFNKARKNFYAKAYVLRVPISSMFILVFIFYLLSKNTAHLYLLMTIFVSSIFIERKFLEFCFKKRGAVFTLQSCFFYFIDGFICTLGVFKALLSFSLIKKRAADV